MSAAAAGAPAIASAGTAGEAEAGRLAPRVAAFAALAAFAAIEYSTLLVHPPTWRVLGAVAISATAGAALASLAGRSLVRGSARVLVVLVTLVSLLVVLGIPPHLLLPWRWGSLASDVRQGVDGLEGWLWPYRGNAPWARVAVLLALAPALTLAATAHFWPAPRTFARELVALGTLLALLLCGLVNQHAPAWRVQGLVLVLLLSAWLWLAWLPGRRLNRALAWVVAAAFGALLLAPALSAPEPWIDYLAWDPVPSSISFQWNQTYGPITWSRSTATVLTVSEHRPELLKVIALDRFDGVGFVRSPAPPGSEPYDLPAARTRFAAQSAQSATVTLTGLRSPQLVTGGGVPERLEALSGELPAVTVTADGVLSLANAPRSGTRYRVTSYAPNPGLSVLRAAPRTFPRAYLPYVAFELPGAPEHRPAPVPFPLVRAGTAGTLLAPPAPGVAPASVPALRARIEDSPYAPAFALARRLAAVEPNSYDVASRIEEYLRAHYRYNERPPLTLYPLESFLTGTAGGYCQQFSGAMTLLLRLDGIPARVAEGFAPGVYDAALGRWSVRAIDAHAWVEAYFSGIGWVPFDPTPPQPGEGLTGAGLGALNRGVGAAAVTTTSTRPRAARARTLSSPVAPSRDSSSAWLLVAAALALVLVLVACMLWLAGRRRLRASLTGSADGAVAELGAALSRLRIATGPGCTLEQLAVRLHDRGATGAARYARLLSALRYAPAPAAAPTPRDRRACRRALRSLAARRRGARRPLARIGAWLKAMLALPPGASRRA
jgi:transglutaminase-like putative cysteine protease